MSSELTDYIVTLAISTRESRPWRLSARRFEIPGRNGCRETDIAKIVSNALGFAGEYSMNDRFGVDVNDRPNVSRSYRRKTVRDRCPGVAFVVRARVGKRDDLEARLFDP
jgi:hypothetical protein